MKTKICSKCGIEKELNCFYKQKSCKNGITSTCRDCKSEYTKKHQVEYWKTEAYKTSRLRKLFGITLNDYNKKLEEQNNTCAICKNLETSRDNRTKLIKNLSVDHDHQSGKVRGLLCGKCNSILGLAKDNINILQSAIDYLKKQD